MLNNRDQELIAAASEAITRRYRNDWQEVREFSRAVARSLAEESPEQYTIAASKAPDHKGVALLSSDEIHSP